MENGDFELGGYLIGAGQPVIVTSFQINPGEVVQQDQINPFASRRMFGRDTQNPPTWEFDFHIANPDGVAADVGVLGALEALTTAWAGTVDAETPGATTFLRYKIGGRVRGVYGRPRNFTPNPSVNIQDGSLTAAAQFALSDAYTYSDELFETELQLRPPPNGAVTLPAVWPLLSEISSTRQGIFTVGGTSPTYPEDITFYGPVVNPSLETLAWKVGWQGTVPYDGWVRINPRETTVLTNTGASVSGGLTRSTFLPDLKFKPGAQDLKFSGVDNTGSSRAVVRWRSAFNSF